MTLAQLYAALLPVATARPCEEVCGLLFGPAVRIRTTITSLDVTGVMPVKNVAASPEDAFALDMDVLREQWRARKGEVLGFYHSHPTGSAMASAHDRWMVEQTGLLSVIIAPRVEMRIYGRHDGHLVEIASWRPLPMVLERLLAFD